MYTLDHFPESEKFSNIFYQHLHKKSKINNLEFLDILPFLVVFLGPICSEKWLLGAFGVDLGPYDPKYGS